MTFRYMLRTMFCLTAGISVPLVASATQTRSLEQEFRSTLLRLAQSGRLPESTGPLVIERPAERVNDFGLLVDRDSAEGLLVLGTLPGGSAERLGLRPGDRLLRANGIDVRGSGGSQRMRELLDALAGDGRVQLQLLREGETQQLDGNIGVVMLPPMRVELLPGSTSSTAVSDTVGDPDSVCARISVEPSAPTARNLFPVTLIEVNGELPGPSSQTTFRLKPGRQTLVVAELIDPKYFSSVANLQRGRRGADRYKTLELEVRPGVTYMLAAQLDRQRSDRIADGSYWAPVVWTERAEPCR